MRFSYNWLKDYIKGRLPKPEKLAELLTLHSFEVESITERAGDYILDIDVLPNRAADSLSHIGIARECAALTNSKLETGIANFSSRFDRGLKSATPRKLKEDRKLKINKFLRVEVKDKKLCHRYTARVITGVKVKDSPKWIKRRLLACGLKSINNIVDATNYVMLEIGQPIHAFDLDKVSGIQNQKSKIKNQKYKSKIKKIIVRRAKKGEKITILDGEEYELDRDILVIADRRQPLAIAGIKGGKKAEINGDTQTIVLESANFNPLAIHRSSKKIGIKSDASRRFEAELDSNLCEPALDRVTGLIQKVAGGKVAKGLVDIYPKKVKVVRIKLDLKQVKKILGIEISRRTLKDTFKHLGANIKEHKFYLEVEIPTWRRDLSISEDLIEEIARIYGYNNIPSQMPEVQLDILKVDVSLFWEDKIKDILAGAGFTEVYNYSFMSDKNFRVFPRCYPRVSASTIEIANPMNINQRYLRASLVPNLLTNVKENLKYFQRFKIFELGKIYYQEGSEIQEKKSLTGAVVGENSRTFYQAKGVVELLLSKLGIQNFNLQPLTFNLESSFWHPSRTAEITIGRKVLGTIGEVHPEILAKYSIDLKVVLFDIDSTKLIELARPYKIYKPVSRYPTVTLDLAVVLPKNFLWADIKNQALKEGGRLVKGIKLFDIYKGRELPRGKISFAFHIIYQAEARTLKEREAKSVHEKIVRALEKIGGEVRR